MFLDVQTGPNIVLLWSYARRTTADIATVTEKTECRSFSLRRTSPLHWNVPNRLDRLQSPVYRTHDRHVVADLSLLPSATLTGGMYRQAEQIRPMHHPFVGRPLTRPE